MQGYPWNPQAWTQAEASDTAWDGGNFLGEQYSGDVWASSTAVDVGPLVRSALVRCALERRGLGRCPLVGCPLVLGALVQRPLVVSALVVRCLGLTPGDGLRPSRPDC